MINGIINVYKEKGFTSHDVVAKLRGITKQKKIGHTGTLDPDATGVLPVCFGNATKVCELLTDQKKEYETTFLLGYTTDTQDKSGKTLETFAVNVTQNEVEQVIRSFEGEYQQIPPMYSALKVNGKKLYELAREGIEIERKARTVQIIKIDIKEIKLPHITMSVICSKGTYIRTLCYDIGQALGCGATMQELVRTKVGDFSVEDAVTLKEIEDMRDQNRLLDVVIPVESTFSECEAYRIKKEFSKFLWNGNALWESQLEDIKQIDSNRPVKILDENNEFRALYQYNTERECFCPVKMFLE